MPGLGLLDPSWAPSSAANDSTLVGLSLPRYARFSARIFLSSVRTKEISWPTREPFQPSLLASASASRAARRNRRAASGASLVQLGSSMEIAMESRGRSAIRSIGRRSAVHPLVGLADG